MNSNTLDKHALSTLKHDNKSNPHNLVIIGASYLQLPLIKKAKEMGFSTHVFAWEEASVGFEYIDHFYPIDIKKIDLIYTQCLQIKPVGITSIASDLANITVNEVARRLKLPCNSKKCQEISTNKYKMRKALAAGGLNCPRFDIVNDVSQAVKKLKNFKFPIIVKPTDRSGSRSITKLINTDGLSSAIESAINSSFEKKSIIEEFIEGEEFSAESISCNGVHHLLAITKKFTTGAPNFIETGHVEPANINDEMKIKIENTIKSALTALKIKNGASHSEFKIDPYGDIRVIEIGSRMGGDFIGSDLVQISTGNDFLEMVILNAIGRNDLITNLQKGHKCFCGVKFIFNKTDYDKIVQYQSSHKSSLIRWDLSDTNFSEKVVNSGSRHGYAIFKFDSYEKAKNFMENN